MAGPEDAEASRRVEPGAASPPAQLVLAAHHSPCTPLRAVLQHTSDGPMRTHNRAEPFQRHRRAEKVMEDFNGSHGGRLAAAGHLADRCQLRSVIGLARTSGISRDRGGARLDSG